MPCDSVAVTTLVLKTTVPADSIRKAILIGFENKVDKWYLNDIIIGTRNGVLRLTSSYLSEEMMAEISQWIKDNIVAITEAYTTEQIQGVLSKLGMATQTQAMPVKTARQTLVLGVSR